MTTIAWDGKVLAADRQGTSGSFTYKTRKIHRVRDGLAAFAGGADYGRAMLEWYKRGAKEEDFPKSQGDKEDWASLTVFKKNGIFRYERTAYAIEIFEKKFAIGSGRDYATAAMYCGKTAREAVAIACRFDESSGLGVEVLRIR